LAERTPTAALLLCAPSVFRYAGLSASAKFGAVCQSFVIEDLHTRAYGTYPLVPGLVVVPAATVPEEARELAQRGEAKARSPLSRPLWHPVDHSHRPHTAGKLDVLSVYGCNRGPAGRLRVHEGRDVPDRSDMRWVPTDSSMTLHTGYDVSVARLATAIVVPTWVVWLSRANERRLTRVASVASIAAPTMLMTTSNTPALMPTRSLMKPATMPTTSTKFATMACMRTRSTRHHHRRARPRSPIGPRRRVTGVLARVVLARTSGAAPTE
jgi:hypothetical protein